MTKRIVAITGIGTLTPAGRGTEALWTRICSGSTCIAQIDPDKYFDPSRYACQVAGQVPSFDEPAVLKPSILAQTDRCSQMALVAAFDALQEAKLPMDFRSEESPVAAERVSLTLSTIAAGWTYVEGEMQSLWTKGVTALRRYGVTAGFPAGPQGHVSIFFGVEGRTRSFVSERASGASALIEGIKTIQRGDADIVIAGGTEAPLTPLVWGAYNAANMLQPTSQPGHPAHQQTRMLIGEGSTFLILEEREHALRRGVPILGEIHGWSRGTDPLPLDSSKPQSGKGIKRAIHTSLAQADIQPTDVDVIFPGGPALVAEDIAEERGIKSVFEQPLPIAAPKTVLGHLQGAAVATDVALATLALHKQMMPPTQDGPGNGDSAHSRECRDFRMRHALILANGLGGVHASFIVSKFE
jgi:3-oxoacyl-(acyl-carrier-protein) synthase